MCTFKFLDTGYESLAAGAGDGRFLCGVLVGDHQAAINRFGKMEKISVEKEQQAQIITIIIALIAVAPLWWDKIFSPRIVRMSATKIRVDALKCYDDLTQSLSRQVSDLQQKVEEVIKENQELREENGDVREWVDRLVAQVISLHGKPVKIRNRVKKE